MGMRTKNSRLITVNGVTYRWKVTDRQDSLRWFVGIQRVAPTGQRLLTRFERPIEWRPNSVGGETGEYLPVAITPSIICRLIEAALERGWQPAEMGGPEFWVDSHEIVPDLPRIEQPPILALSRSNDPVII